MIWYSKRQRWGQGPTFPQNYKRSCSATLNYTSVLTALIQDEYNGNSLYEISREGTQNKLHIRDHSNTYYVIESGWVG